MISDKIERKITNLFFNVIKYAFRQMNDIFLKQMLLTLSLKHNIGLKITKKPKAPCPWYDVQKSLGYDAGYGATFSYCITLVELHCLILFQMKTPWNEWIVYHVSLRRNSNSNYLIILKQF